MKNGRLMNGASNARVPKSIVTKWSVQCRVTCASISDVVEKRNFCLAFTEAGTGEERGLRFRKDRRAAASS